MENTQKEILLSAMPDEVKGTAYRKNRKGGHKLANNEQITNLFFDFFNLKMLSAYMETKQNAKNRKIDLSPLQIKTKKI
jgi:hypothetical protein